MEICYYLREMRVEKLNKSMPAGKKSSGYTLVEVIIASYILTVVFAALFGAIGQGMNMVEYSRDLTRVSQILQSEMEELRTLNWEELEDMKATTPFEIYSPETKFNTAFNQRYTIYRQVLAHPVNTSDMLRVRLYVVWNAPGAGGFQWRLLTTDFTEDGLNDYYYRNV